MSAQTPREPARALLDRISLELVLHDSTSPENLQSLMRQLGESLSGKEDRRLFRALEASLKAIGGASGQEAFAAAVEAMRRHLSAHPAKAKPAARRPTGKRVPEQASALVEYEKETPSEIMESFYLEAGAHLQTIEQKLLALETNPNDRDALDAVFGSLHSMKGITAFLGVSAARELAHEAETLMDLPRKSQTGVRPEQCHALLQVVDVLRAMVDAIREHAKQAEQPFPEVPSAHREVLEHLKRLAGGHAIVPLQATETEREAAPAVLEGPPDKAANGSKSSASARKGSFDLVRVQVEKLDRLMEAIGELVVIQSQICQDADLRRNDGSRFTSSLGHLVKITRELQEVAMTLRMNPLRETFTRMTRIASDLAYQQGKEIEVEVGGAETEMDKNLIESLMDPLGHLVRNAVDHGIGTAEERARQGKSRRAKLRLSARNQGDQVIVSVSDDGGGLDLQKILARARAMELVGEGEILDDEALSELIFEPGFSTADKVTEVSGRGVGLDVVRRSVVKLGGRVSVESARGSHTTFSLCMPLTLAIIEGLSVGLGSERFILPVSSVVEVVRPKRSEISTVQGKGELVDVRGAALPLFRLSEFARVSPKFKDPWDAIVMIVEAGKRRCGLMADELLGLQQVVIKSLGGRLRGVPGVLGGTVLGNGCVGLVLDVPELIKVCQSGTVRPEVECLVAPSRD